MNTHTDPLQKAFNHVNGKLVLFWQQTLKQVHSMYLSHNVKKVSIVFCRWTPPQQSTCPKTGGFLFSCDLTDEKYNLLRFRKISVLKNVLFCHFTFIWIGEILHGLLWWHFNVFVISRVLPSSWCWPIWKSTTEWSAPSTGLEPVTPTTWCHRTASSTWGSAPRKGIPTTSSGTSPWPSGPRRKARTRLPQVRSLTLFYPVSFLQSKISLEKFIFFYKWWLVSMALCDLCGG